jgi:EmrB/QacA subfamily drug resistance transporter
MSYSLSRPQKVATMVGSLLGLLLAALDQTIVATAGPKIQHELGIDPALYIWITTAYLVASTVLVPVWGKLSDLYGRKPILLVGMSIFLLGSALCGFAQTTLQLILFRAIQGMGSGSLFTNAFAVIADLFEPQERGKYQGIFGGVFALSSVVGPLAGGFITDHLTWNWVFFVNLPIGAVALGFVVARMPMLRRPVEGKITIDIAGVLALVVATVPLLLALSLGQTASAHQQCDSGWLWTSPQILGLFATSLVGAIAFVLIERRAADPILDLRLIRNKPFAIGNLGAFTVGLSFLGAIVFLPLFMVNVVGLSATNSGLTTVPLTMGIVAANITSGQIVSRIGKYKPLLIGAIIMMIVAFLIMGFTLAPDDGQASVSFKMILVGLGLGPTIPLFVLAIQTSVEPRQIGVATSTATFSRSMGATIGAAILGTVFATTLAAGMPKFRPAPADAPAAHMEKCAVPAAGGHAPPAVKQAFTDAIEAIYRWCAVIAVAGLLVTAFLPALPLRKGGPPAPPPVE